MVCVECCIEVDDDAEGANDVMTTMDQSCVCIQIRPQGEYIIMKLNREALFFRAIEDISCEDNNESFL